ncbi:hypothetical protein C8R43DRAFT_948646 [Mycena crocata]|nr:hypothetical protein C8R43DRAFT_948646 [Mycena crocata]
MYRDDSLALKTIVGVLAVMAYGKCIQTFVTVWAQLVINFEALELAVSLTDRTLYAGLVGPTVNFLPGCFLLFSLPINHKGAVIALYFKPTFVSAFSRYQKWHVVVPIAILRIAGFTADVTASRQNSMPITSFEEASMYLELSRVSRREVLPQSVGILNALIRLTFQTAALATACALTNFVLSLTFPEVYPTARATASLASDIVLSNLYAFSMMGTLNERRHIRSTASCEVGGGLSEVDFRERRVVEDAELQERVLNNLNKREVPSQFSRNTKEMRPSATTGAARRLAKARGSCP